MRADPYTITLGTHSSERHTDGEGVGGMIAVTRCNRVARCNRGMEAHQTGLSRRFTGWKPVPHSNGRWSTAAPGTGAVGWLAVAAAIAPGAWANGQTLEVTPDDTVIVTFSGFEGGAFLPETTTVWTLDNTDAQALDFTASSNQAWLRVAPETGPLPGSVILNRTRDVVASVDVDEAGKLAPGVYTGSVTFTNQTNGAGNTTRPVRLRVAPANFSISPAFVNALAPVGPGAPGVPTPVPVTLRSNGQTDLNYNLTFAPRSWFAVDKTSGTVPGGGTDSFNVSFNPSGLAAGTYSAFIEVVDTTNGAGSRQLPIGLVVQSFSAGAVTLLPNADIEIRGPAGSLPSVAQISTLANSSGGSVVWNATPSEDWVSITPSGGELAAGNGIAGGLDEQTVEVRGNAGINSLEAGSHAATVEFENRSALVNIGSRVVRVIADPVLTLTVPLAGGSVTVSPSGVTASAGSQNRLVFDFGEVVTLSADVANGFQFDGWSANFELESPLHGVTALHGATAEDNPLVVTMDRSRSVSALIVPIARTLTLSTTGSGTGTIKSTPTGTMIDNALVSRYNNGTEVRLAAEADAGSVFGGWVGNIPAGKERSNPITVVMDRERTISARFDGLVTLTVSIVGEGTVTVEPELAVYRPGTEVTLTATPALGFVFQGWSGGGNDAAATLTLTLGEDTSVEATFGPSSPGDGGDDDPGAPGETFQLFVDIAGDGLVTPDGGEFDAGVTVTLVATPSVGWTFSEWQEDAEGTALTATVVMDGDHTVLAVFEEAPDDDASGRPNPAVGSCGAVGMFGLPVLMLGGAMLTGFRGRWSKVRSSKFEF